MQSIEVLTSQNVRIKYKIASLGDRIVAYLIDGLILIAYLFIMIYSLIQAEILSPYPYVIVALPFLFYHLLCEIFMEGQSVGKRQMRIKVIKLDGSRPGFGAYLLRWLLRPIDNSFYGGVAMVTISFSGKGQRLGDLAAGTSVIKLSPPAGNLTSSPLHHSFDDSYEVVYQEVSRLNDHDIDLIDQALDYNRKEGNPGPANLLAQKLAEKMGVKLNEPQIKFLYTVKKDYMHLTSQ